MKDTKKILESIPVSVIIVIVGITILYFGGIASFKFVGFEATTILPEYAKVMDTCLGKIPADQDSEKSTKSIGACTQIIAQLLDHATRYSFNRIFLSCYICYDSPCASYNNSNNATFFLLCTFLTIIVIAVWIIIGYFTWYYLNKIFRGDTDYIDRNTNWENIDLMLKKKGFNRAPINSKDNCLFKSLNACRPKKDKNEITRIMNSLIDESTIKNNNINLSLKILKDNLQNLTSEDLYEKLDTLEFDNIWNESKYIAQAVKIFKKSIVIITSNGKSRRYTYIKDKDDVSGPFSSSFGTINLNKNDDNVLFLGFSGNRYEPILKIN